MAKSLKSFLAKKYPAAMDVDIITEVKYLDTGIPTMNYLISGRPLTGGLPLTGKTTILYGPEGCGKTSFVAHMIAKAQQLGCEVVFLDTERSITKPRLHQFGVDIESMCYLTPDHMEECFDIIEEIAKERLDSDKDNPILIIWDSLAMTPTKEEIDRTSEDKEVASQAKVLTRNLRRIRRLTQKINCSLLLINQARDNQDKYGDLFTMPGGHGLQHSADVIIRVNKVKPDEEGQGIKFSTPTKNRLFRPFQNTVLRFEYVKGFTKENIADAFCDFLKQIEILGSAGAYCYLATDVQELMKKENLPEKEAIKQVKKFYKKDFVDRLISDPEYYNKVVGDAEEYVNKHISLVSRIMFDPESDAKLVKKYDGELATSQSDIEEEEE